MKIFIFTEDAPNDDHLIIASPAYTCLKTCFIHLFAPKAKRAEKERSKVSLIHSHGYTHDIVLHYTDEETDREGERRALAVQRAPNVKRIDIKGIAYIRWGDLAATSARSASERTSECARADRTRTSRARARDVIGSCTE